MKVPCAEYVIGSVVVAVIVPPSAVGAVKVTSHSALTVGKLATSGMGGVDPIFNLHLLAIATPFAAPESIRVKLVPSTTSKREGATNPSAEQMAKSPVFWSMSNERPYPNDQEALPIVLV